MRTRAEIADEIIYLLDNFQAAALTTEELSDLAMLLRCFSHPARRPISSGVDSVIDRPILRVVE